MYLLHVNDIIAVFRKVGAEFSSILSLRPIHVVGLKNRGETCNIETQRSEFAAGGRRMSRRREEYTKNEKRSHRVSQPLFSLQTAKTTSF